MAGLNETPSGNRLHIGVFGKTNSGKSSFINRFSGQNISIVADVAGTTTDPVYKAMEVYPLGPCTLIDTAGFNDETELGEERLEKTKLAAEKTDIAIILLTDTDMDEELHWYEYFREKKTSVIWVIGKADIRNDTEKINEKAVSTDGTACSYSQCRDRSRYGSGKKRACAEPAGAIWCFFDPRRAGNKERSGYAGYAAGYSGTEGQTDPATGADTERIVR